ADVAPPSTMATKHISSRERAGLRRSLIIGERPLGLRVFSRREFSESVPARNRHCWNKLEICSNRFELNSTGKLRQMEPAIRE
ncbi:MAG: hypothetical protein NT069_34590, partial [Planctomycetota bacterium]|nr:hypothetical protein [Planctomycetota bacterium]